MLLAHAYHMPTSIMMFDASIHYRAGEGFRSHGGAPRWTPTSNKPAHIAQFVRDVKKEVDRRVSAAIRQFALAKQVDAAEVASVLRVQDRSLADKTSRSFAAKRLRITAAAV